MKEKFTTLLDVDDETIENLGNERVEQALTYVHDHLTHKGCPELRGSELWARVFRRALVILLRRLVYRSRKTNFRETAAGTILIERAAIVADDHVREYGVDEITKTDANWPTVHQLMAKWEIDLFQLRGAHQQAMSHKWKHKYIVEDSLDTQKAIVRRAAMRDVAESKDAEFRYRSQALKTAADILGLTKRSTEIHVGNKNTLNVMMPSGDEFQKRLQRVREVDAKLFPQNTEVPVEGSGLEVSRQAEEAPLRARRDDEEAGPPAA